jgi:hypothetical protein
MQQIDFSHYSSDASTLNAFDAPKLESVSLPMTYSAAVWSKTVLLFLLVIIRLVTRATAYFLFAVMDNLHFLLK